MKTSESEANTLRANFEAMSQRAYEWHEKYLTAATEIDRLRAELAAAVRERDRLEKLVDSESLRKLLGHIEDCGEEAPSRRGRQRRAVRRTPGGQGHDRAGCRSSKERAMTVTMSPTSRPEPDGEWCARCGGYMGPGRLWRSPDPAKHYRVTDDGEGVELRYALWSCNVVIARFRTLECAMGFAEVCSAWLKETA